MNKSGAFSHYFFMQSFDHVRRGGMLSRSSAPLTFDAIYPVGSIITTTDPYFNPNSASGWSGTWERLNRKCFLYHEVEHPGQYAGSYEKTYNCSSTTLDLSQIPSHSHELYLASDSAGAHTHTTQSTSSGISGTHKHLVDGDTNSEQGHYHTIDLLTVGYPDETSCHIHTVPNDGFTTITQGTGTDANVLTRYPGGGGWWIRRFDTASNSFLDSQTQWGLTDEQIYELSGGHQHKVQGNTSFHDGHNHSIYFYTSDNGIHDHTIPALTTSSTGAHTHDIYGEASTAGGGQSHNHNLTFHVDDFQHYNCIFWVRTA